jgi:hypothetical protein
MKFRLGSIESNYDGFSQLADIAEATKELFWDDIEIDMMHTSWFDANMCAPFGAILYKASRDLNTVKISDKMPSRIKDILSKNRFLSNYGIPAIYDTYGTTVEYKRFEPKDERYFADYIEKKLVRKDIMPEMSEALLKKFRESIFEIFNNAVIHSKTEMGIFSCGQYYPNQNRFDFCIADLGVGIRQNVIKYLKKEISADEAILWALKIGNTTKTGKVPGGIGLKLLREFISKNKGRIQIVSDKGYWELAKDGTELIKTLQFPFPGTAVNIEFNTSDTHSYFLASEIRNEDIF